MSSRTRRRLPGAARAARLAILLLGPALAWWPAQARADEATARPDVPDAAARFEVARSRMRLRFGASAIANFGAASYGSAGAAQNVTTFNASSPAGVVGGGGFAVDAGLQLGDTAAVYLRGEASGLAPPGNGPDVAGYAVAEWTPRYWISLGSGLGYEDLGPAGSYNGYYLPRVENTPHWTGVSVPVLVTFNLLQLRLPDEAYRAAIRLGLEGAAGFSPANGAYDWHVCVSLGAALM